MNGGIMMANLNGMGPLNEGPLTGRGRGNCSPNSNAGTKLGVGLGLLGLAWGCGRGMRNRGRNSYPIGRGMNARYQGNKERLSAYKKQLEEELELINKQMNT